MERCKQKAIHMKILKKQYGLARDELNFSKDKIEKIERYQIALIKYMSDKPIDKYEFALQEFVIFVYNRTKLASMIYEMSKRKGEGLGYHQKPYNPRDNILTKPSNPSSSSTAQRG